MKTNISINAHSSIRVEGEKVLYFDPFMVTVEPHDGDIIFFTHSHYDHFSPKDYEKLANTDTIFVAPKSTADELKKAGIPGDRTVLLEPGEKTEILGIPVEAVPAYNIGKRFHQKEYGWLGYVVTVSGERVYVCGDTDDTPEARAVKCDILLAPVGGTYTMTAKEAAELAAAIAPRLAIPTHYGSAVGKNGDGEKFVKAVKGRVNVELRIDNYTSRKLPAHQRRTAIQGK